MKVRKSFACSTGGQAPDEDMPIHSASAISPLACFVIKASAPYYIFQMRTGYWVTPKSKETSPFMKQKSPGCLIV